jgi:hypothetical protein
MLTVSILIVGSAIHLINCVREISLTVSSEYNLSIIRANRHIAAIKKKFLGSGGSGGGCFGGLGGSGFDMGLI